MGIGKASVYKYIPEYFPRDVGAVGGLVGTLGALGGFFLPLGFGYLEKATGRPESCFWVMLALIAVSLVWLHAIVSGMRRRSSIRFISSPWKRATGIGTSASARRAQLGRGCARPPPSISTRCSACRRRRRRPSCAARTAS